MTKMTIVAFCYLTGLSRHIKKIPILGLDEAQGPDSIIQPTVQTTTRKDTSTSGNTRVYLSVGTGDILNSAEVCDIHGMTVKQVFSFQVRDGCPFQGQIRHDRGNEENEALADIFHSCSGKSKCTFNRKEFQVKELFACDIDIQYECKNAKVQGSKSTISPTQITTRKYPTTNATPRPRPPATVTSRPSSTEPTDRNSGQNISTEKTEDSTNSAETATSVSSGDEKKMVERSSVFMIIVITVGSVAVVAVIVAVLLCGLFVCGWSPKFQRWVSIRRHRRQQQQQQQTPEHQADEYAYIDERELLSNSKTDSTALSPVANAPTSSKYHSPKNPSPRFVSGPGLVSLGGYVEVPDPKAWPDAEYSNVNLDAIPSVQPSLPGSSARTPDTSISIAHAQPHSLSPTLHQTKDPLVITLQQKHQQQTQAGDAKSKDGNLLRPPTSLKRVIAPESQPPVQYTLPALKDQQEKPRPRSNSPNSTQSSDALSLRAAGPPSRPAPLLPRESTRRRASLPRQSKLMENVPEDIDMLYCNQAPGVSSNSQPSLAVHNCSLQQQTNDSNVLDLELYAHLGQSTKRLDSTNVYDG